MFIIRYIILFSVLLSPAVKAMDNDSADHARDEFLLCSSNLPLEVIEIILNKDRELQDRVFDDMLYKGEFDLTWLVEAIYYTFFSEEQVMLDMEQIRKLLLDSIRKMPTKMLWQLPYQIENEKKRCANWTYCEFEYKRIPNTTYCDSQFIPNIGKMFNISDIVAELKKMVFFSKIDLAWLTGSIINDLLIINSESIVVDYYELEKFVKALPSRLPRKRDLGSYMIFEQLRPYSWTAGFIERIARKFDIPNIMAELEKMVTRSE